MIKTKATLKRAFYVGELEKENKELRDQVEGSTGFEEMLGSSEAMQEVFSTIRKVSVTDASVLITGESGTGKELVARAVHHRSVRAKSPFVVINCGAIPENLLESELFGHEKGAFTGAIATKKGKVELADKGTVFFDEIGDLPLQLQVKLLRFLQDRVVEHIGGGVGVEVDVRVLAATNMDLKTAIDEGAFREDLYYRLAVIHMELPPLRIRHDDLVLCAIAFLQRLGRENKKRFKGYAQDAIDAITEYRWPGNVRELENKVRRAVIMADGDRITAKDMALASVETLGAEELDFKRAREKAEKKVVGKAMLKHAGNQTGAARTLGISRPTLHDLIKKYDINV